MANSTLMTVSTYITGLGVFTSIIINWKTFFRPDIKLLKERELDAMENLHEFVMDYRIHIPSLTKDKYISIENLNNLINEKEKGLYSIYIYNKNIKRNLSDFLRQIVHIQLNEYNNTEKEKLKKSYIKLKKEVDIWFEIKKCKSFSKRLIKKILYYLCKK